MGGENHSARLHLVAVTASLACAACQHVPPAPLDAAANAERIAARSLVDPAVQAALARHDVRVAANAWSLDQLTLASWVLRTDLAVARAEVAAARAKTAVEGQRQNPTVSAPLEKVTDAGVADPWVIGAALALTFESGGKREIRQARALAEVRALEWQFGEALWSARVEVRAALLDLKLADMLVALDDDTARLTREFLSWVDTRLEHGAATTSERLAAAQALNQAESRRALDGIALATASARLAAAVGVTPRELAGVTPVLPELDALSDLPALDVGAARSVAVVNRLDVRRALAEYDVAEQDLRAAVASQYPDIVLAPGYTVDQADHKITLGLDLPVPLFHDASAAISRAIAARAVAAAQFDDVQAGALAAIDVGFAQFEAARGALAAAEHAAADAEAAVAALERRLAAGAANRGEVLAGQIALAGLRQAVLAARRSVLDAATALETAIERPVFPESAIDAAGSIRELLVGPAQ